MMMNDNKQIHNESIHKLMIIHDLILGALSGPLARAWRCVEAAGRRVGAGEEAQQEGAGRLLCLLLLLVYDSMSCYVRLWYVMLYIILC